MLGPAEFREITEAMGEGERERSARTLRLPLAIRLPMTIAEMLTRRWETSRRQAVGKPGNLASPSSP